jgi:hypothetical protein
MQKSESFIDWILWLGSFVAGLVLLYFLAAPPVIMAACKQSGSFTIPMVYWPVMRIIESDFGSPLVWYFNNVWHAGLIMMGDESGPPWYMVALYAVVGIGLVAAIFFPFIRRMRRRRT